MRLVCLPTILLSLSISGQTRLAYDPFVKGASADVEIAVSDDEGVAIGGAEVSVWFEVSSVKSEERKGATAADGIFAASLNTCTGGVIVNVKKDGYYANYRGVYYDGTIVRGRVMVALLDNRQIITLHMTCPGWFNESYMNVVAHFRDTVKQN